jgi:AraC-like DNA-binding protein
LVLFTKGKETHSIDFEKFPVQPFQIYFMVSGQVHRWHFEGVVEGYIVHFNEVLFTSFLQSSHYLEHFTFFGGISRDSVLQLPVSMQDVVVPLFEVLLREINQGEEKSLDMVRMKLLELLLLVHRNGNRKQERNIPSQKRTLFRSFQQLIDKHFKDIRFPKGYADLLYITRNHLNALCQDLVGRSAGELIREQIVLEANRLLTYAGMTVSEIAYDLNFQDNSYFNRFFKKQVGVTPEEFRKALIEH